MNIAKYVAEIGFEVRNKDIQKVDKALSSIEKKMRDFNKRLSSSYVIDVNKFNVNQRSLERSLGNALDIASNKVVFEISKFSVNDRNLQAAILKASRGVGLGGGGFGRGSGQLSPDEWNRRTLMSSRLRREEGVARQQERLELAAMRRDRASRSGDGVRASTGIGGIGLGLMGPVGYTALALAGGGYGLGALNQRNQEVVSAQLQSQAVVQQAGGTAEQGQASFQYLRSEANRIGFNYLDASADYNKLISGLTGSGFSVRDSQKVFSGFAELARVNKLDKTTQNRLFRALSQVAGKGKLQAEELTSQISEALPGGTALFARAYQAQLAAQGKGGGLTGQAAIEKLRSDMQKGLVTSEILRYAGIDASTQANKGGALALARTASQAEQERYQNTVSDLAVVASNAGVEEGFARIFRTLNAGLSESNGLVRGLAEGFNEATKWTDDLLLFPQSFIRALQGRDSVVADWLGKEQTEELKKDWEEIKTLWQEITGIETPAWMPTLQSTAQELKYMLHQLAELSTWKNRLVDSTSSDAPEYSFWTNPITRTYQLGGRALDLFSDSQNAYNARLTAINDPNNPYYGDLERYNSDERAGVNRYSPIKGISNPTSVEQRDFDMQTLLATLQDVSTSKEAAVNNQISITLNIDPITMGQMDIQAQAYDLSQTLALNLEKLLVFFPNKE